MDIKKFLLGYLVSSVGLTKEEAAAKIADIESDDKDEDASKEILGSFKAKIDDLKKTAFDDGHKKAAKEVKFAFEKDLKEKYGVSSDKIGMDLVEEIVASKTKGTGKDGKDLTDDEIKKHPLYLKLESDSKKAVKDAETNYQAELKKLEDANSLKETLKEVATLGIAEFEKLNPILSADAGKAAKQKALIQRELEGRKYQKVGNDFIILKEDGSRLEDEHGNPVRLSSLVKQVSDDLGFDYKAAEQKRDSAAGGQNKETGGEEGKKYTGKMPTSENEFHAILFDASLSVEQKEEVQQAWKEKQSSN